MCKVNESRWLGKASLSIALKICKVSFVFASVSDPLVETEVTSPDNHEITAGSCSSSGEDMYRQVRYLYTGEGV